MRWASIKGPRSSRAAFLFWSVILLLLASAYLADSGLAHDNIVVHPDLTVDSFNVLNSPFYSSRHPGSQDDARQGSIDEDEAPRWLGHYYNPVTNSVPVWASGMAPDKATEAWAEAIARYNAQEYLGSSGAFHSLGRVLHLLQDMTSPAHVHDDPHLPGDPDDFEDWGPSHLGDYDFSGVQPKTVPDRTAAAFLRALAGLTYWLTVYQTELDEVAGEQPDSLLSQMFPGGTFPGPLIYYDGGLLGDNYWEIDRIGKYEAFLESDAWWIVDESYVEDNDGRNGSRRLTGNVYIENTGGNTVEPVPAMFNGKPNSAERTLLQLYGDSLYKEAVAYGAGLIQVFTESVPVSAPPSNLVATSISATQINLSWTDTDNETEYRVERKTGAGGTYSQIGTVGTNVAGYQDTGLSASTTYFYRVRACNVTCSDYSSEALATTASLLPLTVTRAGAGSGTVRLDPPGIACDPTCSVSFNAGTHVTLTATPAAGGTFKEWRGACPGSGNPICTFTVTAPTTATAVFSQAFTDEPLNRHVTLVKAGHLAELRQAINTLRSGWSLSPFSWTDPTLTARSTPIKTVHLTELRTALSQAYTAAGRTPPTYTDPTLTARVTLIKATHVSELRAAVRDLE